MEQEVQPIIADFWERDEFPFELLPKIQGAGHRRVALPGLRLPGLQHDAARLRHDGNGARGLVDLDLLRRAYRPGDGLDLPVRLGGAEAASGCRRWRRWRRSAAFGLTEPDVGSGTAGGLTTTAKRDGDTWILNGQKKWIGNATWGDLTIIWARDVDDDQVKGFIVENTTAGFNVEKIHHKMALRVVQNGLITLTDCRVGEANRLQNANSFRDTARVLAHDPRGRGWESVGCARGAYEHALRYAQRRMQFGKPIAGFQLVQDLLFRMLCNITSSQAMCVRLSQMQDQGLMRDEHASLAKGVCTVRMRETVGWARELLGANGILLDQHVGRFVADAEALYSYEGTREMNALIVGKAITGFSAFV